MSLSNTHDDNGLAPPLFFSIEPMREQDLQAVVEIEGMTGLNRWGYDAYRRELARNPNAVMLIARNLLPGSEVIGFLAGWIVEDELHVNNIATHPDYRRQGVARALLDEVMGAARRRGIGYVLLEVRASNEAAQSLYLGLGFQYVGRRRDYYRSPTEDALMMRLDL